MAMTDQCVHGALMGACVYCAMGSKTAQDVARRLDVMDIAREIMIGRDNKIAIEAALEQRNVLMQATNEIGAYLEQAGSIDDEGAAAAACKFMIRRLRGAIDKCHELQRRVDNPRKV